MMNPKYKLFFLKQNSFFDEGTLFELADKIISEASLDKSFDQRFNTVPPELCHNFGYFLPDRSDGNAGFIARDSVLECPPFAENVPPGNCRVKITALKLLSRADTLFNENVNALKIFDVRVEQTIHYQKIVVPVPKDFPEIQSVVVRNSLKNFEVDEYETPSLENLAESRAYCLHIGHLPPGFYETEIKLPKAKYIRLRFIKFFPAHFEERYALLSSASNAVKTKVPTIENSAPDEVLKVSDEAFKTIESEGEDGFSAELLNVALRLKTEWGENFRKPIDERLLDKFPALSAEEIAKIDKIVGKTESFICDLAERELNGEISETDIVTRARAEIFWINDWNLFRIKNIGMYWARK